MNEEELNNRAGLDAATSRTAEEVLSFTPTPLQQRVIDIAIALMEDHYTLDTDRLHKACVRAIKDYDVSAIDAALSDLYTKRVLVGGTAITKLTILDNQNRDGIYRLIKRSPAINAARIQQTLDLSFGTVAWHLKMLAKFKLVRLEYINEALTCFDISIDKRLDAALVMLQKKQIPDILAVIMQARAVRSMEAFSHLDIPRTTLLRKLKDLETVGIITRDDAANESPVMLIAPAHVTLVEQALKR